VAAVTAQLTVSARTASAWAAVALVAAYLLRALGDVAGDAAGPAFWSWLSPIGWAEQVRPYAGDRWWALLAPIAFTAAAVWLAYALAARRDLGAGLLPDRVGPARAAPRLSSPLALAWRLQRAALAGWAVAFALLGAIFGSIATNLGDLLDSEAVRDLFERLGGTDVLTDAFVATEMGFVALFAAAYGVSAALRLHGEEQSGHAEVLLAGAVSRRRWLGSHLAVAVLGTALLCLVAGASAGVSYGLASGSAGKGGPVVAGLLAYLPAIWVMTALVVWLFGWLPRFVVFGWGALVAAVLVGELGPLLNLPSWAMDLSPFTHVPKIPGEDWTWGGWLAVLAVAIGLAAWGAAGFRRRDLDTP
jgi:ABC-2 type transport system permease protein